MYFFKLYQYIGLVGYRHQAFEMMRNLLLCYLLLAPIALHQLVMVPPGGNSVIRLRAYDTNGDQVKYCVDEKFNIVIRKLSALIRNRQLCWYREPLPALSSF